MCYDYFDNEDRGADILRKAILTIALLCIIVICIVSTMPVHAEEAFSTTPMIAGGEEHTIALKSDGTVWGWGSYYHGQLGNGAVGEWRPQGSDAFQVTPAQVAGLDHMVAVAAGQYHTVTLRRDGTVWAFGFDDEGQLGDGNGGEVGRRNPMTVQAKISNATAIAAGKRHSVALRDDGTVWTWGSNYYGQLGHGEPGWPNKQNVPAQVQGVDHVISIAAGSDHTVALRDDGTVWLWGLNDRGQLGNGTGGQQAGEDEEADFSALPVQAQGLVNITAIAAGTGHTIALREDGTVWVWGANWRGQIGDGTLENDDYRTIPTQIGNLSDVTAIAGGHAHSVVMKKDGSVWAWGLNVDGQLGVGSGWNEDGHRLTPVQTNHINNVISIAAGDTHTIVMRDDGTVWAWGNNRAGQVGDGTVCEFGDYRPNPQQVLGPDGVGYLNLLESSHQSTEQTESPTESTEPISDLPESPIGPSSNITVWIIFVSLGVALTVTVAILLLLKKRRRW